MMRRYLIAVAVVCVALLLSSAIFWKNHLNYITTRIKSQSPSGSQGRTATKQIVCEDGVVNSNSSWFREKVNFDTDTHWTKETISVDKDVRNWWMKLQRRTEDNLTDAMEELFKVGVRRKVEIPDKHEGCISCAVVGNSDNLLMHQYGKLINNHTYVLRFNGAVTEGYEKHAGSKWTHLFLYPETGVSKVPENTFAVLVPFKPPDLRWLASALGGKPFTFKSYARAPSRMDCNESKILVLHPHFMSYVHTNWMEKKGIKPSTGMLGLIYALHRCNKVDVFGFGANDRGLWMHYFDKETNGGDSSHDDGAEKHIIQMLEKEGIIQFYH